MLLLEREPFPRYHIGESLIPYTWFTLNRLGVVDWLRKSACPKKYSVQFVSITGKVSQPFYFFNTIHHECSQTWQVWRGEFDQMLLDNAVSKGVDAPSARHRPRRADGRLARRRRPRRRRRTARRARKSARKSSSMRPGRDSLLSRKFGWKDKDPDLNKIAVWSYFEGALRDPGLDEGATTVAYVPQKGWFWYIPLHSNIVSVGVVGEPGYLYRDTRDPDAIFQREVAGLRLDSRTRQSRQAGQPVRVTGEYSYHSKQIGGDGFCLVGDAFAFLDPLFSTGVFLGAQERRDGRRRHSCGPPDAAASTRRTSTSTTRVSDAPS